MCFLPYRSGLGLYISFCEWQALKLSEAAGLFCFTAQLDFNTTETRMHIPFLSVWNVWLTRYLYVLELEHRQKKHKPTGPILTHFYFPLPGELLRSHVSFLYSVDYPMSDLSLWWFRNWTTFFLSFCLLLELPETATNTSNMNITIRTVGLQCSLRRIKNVFEAVYMLYW